MKIHLKLKLSLLTLTLAGWLFDGAVFSSCPLDASRNSQSAGGGP